MRNSAESLKLLQVDAKPLPRKGNYVVVHLDTNTLLLKSGQETLATITLVSQGKPGSYYETIGGEYTGTYKEPLHFSSIGHVYMPFSIHVFGNYFIHGIPYYPDGTKVSSTYSGGCIRLADNDAERVYNFITDETPIIITRGGEDDFASTTLATGSTLHADMTRLMVATISLEYLTQDNEITNIDGDSITTRRNILPQLLVNQDVRVSTLYARSMGEDIFIKAMNDKARSLGLTNTNFTSVTEAVFTTEEDYNRFMDYINTYKSYLRTY
jgi:hypothetical protein